MIKQFSNSVCRHNQNYHIALDNSTHSILATKTKDARGCDVIRWTRANIESNKAGAFLKENSAGVPCRSSFNMSGLEESPPSRSTSSSSDEEGSQEHL